MAGLAVGLSKSVVVGAITVVESAIAEDARLQQKVKRDLVFITLELEMMQSFLKDANQEMKNNLVKTWVKHIRQLVYEVEDCAENVVHLDNKPVFWRRLLPSLIAPELPLDVAVAELEQLRGRMEDTNNCYRRYNLINVNSAVSLSTSTLHALMPPPPPPESTAKSNMLAVARDTTRMQQGFGDLTRLIMTDEEYLGVISVWGAGGDHRTTSIIRKTFNHSEICRNFSARAWVKLMHPFSPQDFVQGLIAQFNKKTGIEVPTKMEVTQDDLINEFQHLVREKRYLVVLEGLSNMVDWDAIRTFFPDMMNGSRIILSTQQSEVATLCVGHPYQILELEKFSEEHSVCALFQSSRDKGKTIQMVLEAAEEISLVGRQREIKRLSSLLPLARVNCPSVMSVCGIAGIGKTALVKSLLHQDHIGFDRFYWVDVSHPFNLRDLYLNLLPDFYWEKDPIEECHQLLRDQRCLIVIDELWSTKEWDLMQAALVPKQYSKSVIIVITPEASIAKYCTNGDELVFNVTALEPAEAFDLFNKVLQHDSMVEAAGVEVQELILKCGGLPTVIAAIAGSLPKKTDKWADTVRSLNRRLMHHLETDPKYFSSLESVFRGMESMVLNPPDFLKPCIFYLSIFPQGKIIRRRRLVRRWIAEGYSGQTSLERQADENGEEFFSELLKMSIFQQVPQLVDTSALDGTRMVFCQVNGFIREYIASRQIEENLVFELGGSSSTQRTGRHLIILKTWVRDRIVFGSIDLSRLRSLTVFGKWKSYFISENMKVLRVLDLEDASSDLNDDDVENIVECLRRLKFLSLRGHSEVHYLPSSLGKLRQLQTLDVRGTSIVTLPASITKLHKLQYIRAGTTDVPPTSARSKWFRRCRRRRRVGGVEVPEGIGKLTELHTLGVVDVPASGGKSILKELNKLTQLRKLGVSGINRKNMEEFASAIKGHGHLESLSVQLDKDDNQGYLDDISLPWANLRSLKLYGLQDKLPAQWREHRFYLSKLRKLDLEMATLEKDDNTEFLARLPELCILRLRVKQLHDDKLHFYWEMYGEEMPTYEKLKILEISCSSSSSLHVIFGSETMKNLELLKLDCSSGSSSYDLTGLNYLSELKEVLLKGTNEEALKTDLEQKLLNHPNKPAVKLEELASSS